MRGLWLLDVIGGFCLLSPPFLLGIAWFRFFRPANGEHQAKWQRIVGAANLLVVSSLLVLCVVKFLRRAGQPSLAGWLTFPIALAALPVLLSLCILGVRGTRMLTGISAFALALDVMLIDAME
jgi:uncharacterized membrane protein SirB2